MSMRKDGLNKTQNQNQKLNLNVDDFGCSIGGESPQFAEIIKDALDYCELEDSLFLAELYHAKVDSDESLLMIADILYRMGRWTELYNLLIIQMKNHYRLRYLFAKACYELDKLDECQSALIDARSGMTVHPNLHPSLVCTKAEPFAYLLLSKVLRRAEKQADTLELLSNCIRENSFLWSAIVDFTKFGGTNVDRLMALAEEKLKTLSIGSSQETVANENNRRQSTRTPMASANLQISPQSSARKKTTPASAIVAPPVRPVAPRKSTRIIDQNAAQVKKRHISTRTSKQINPPSSALIGQKESNDNTSSTRQLRKAKPLSTHNSNPLQTAARRLSDSNYSLTSDTTLEEDENRMKGTECSSVFGEMVVFMRRLAEIEEALQQHEYTNAKNLIMTAPGILRSTVICSIQLARAEFELHKFLQARDVLQRMHRYNPHTTMGMELLSTVLWYLEDRKTLSALALKMHNDLASQTLPETWIVIANAFSLQGEHQQAISSIQRAMKLNPRLSYLYSMAGHEYIALDDLPAAEEAYKKAIVLHPRCYRAHFGLGQVQLKKEQHNLARSSLNKAHQINPYNKTVLCVLAEIEGFLRGYNKAFELLDIVLKMDPGYMAALFQRAKMMYQLGQYDDCLKDLLNLKELSPNEASVHHLLGRVYRRLNSPHLSMSHYSWANSMDPNSCNTFASDLVMGVGSESGSEIDCDDDVEDSDEAAINDDGTPSPNMAEPDLVDPNEYL